MFIIISGIDNFLITLSCQSSRQSVNESDDFGTVKKFLFVSIILKFRQFVYFMQNHIRNFVLKQKLSLLHCIGNVHFQSNFMQIDYFAACTHYLVKIAIRFSLN